MRIIYHHRTQGEEPESIHINEIVNALRELGHQVFLVGPAMMSATRKGKASPTLSGRIKRAVPRATFEVLQIAYNIVVAARLSWAIWKIRPDMIYERYALYNFAGVWISRHLNVPLVLEVNTPYAQAWSQYYGLLFKHFAERVERRTIIGAGHVITVTAAQRDMLESIGVRRAAITVCHNAIDPSWFEQNRHFDEKLRNKLGLSGVVVGFVGTMNRWQGIPEFCGVVNDVLTQRKNASFLFVGDGEFREELESFCRQQGWGKRVIFVGRVPHVDIPPLMAAMDIAVLLNSNNYGSPMKLFEYMGMGKAIVAPTVKPVSEIMIDGLTGLLIPPGDAKQMVRKVIELIDDPSLRRRLGVAGRTYVTANHTWGKNALKVLEAYEKCLSSNRTKQPVIGG